MHDQRIIDDVLQELYAVDPTLRDQEDRLVKAVRALLAAKPEAALDERFVRELRKELLGTFSAATASVKPNIFDFIMKNDSLKYLVPSGIVAVLVLSVLVSTKAPGSPSSAPAASVATESAAEAGGVRVSKVADGAFGVLSTGVGADQAPMAANLGRGGGGGGNGSAPAVPMADSKMMLPYVPSYYAYSYAGDLALDDESVPVYRRQKGGSSAVSGGLLDAATLGLVDPSRLDAVGLQSLALVQDKEFGYYVYVDMNEGMISLSQNYAKWPHPEQECRDEECFARYRLHESDMLSDAETFAVADAFLKELGVNVGSYGSPAVAYDWRTQYASLKGEDRAAFYFPETVSVVYPLVIDGQKVYDESGNPTGLTVNVNVRHKRADGLWNLTTLKYDSAQYAAVTDKSKLMGVVARGGVYEATPPDDAKTEEVGLGTPERVLMRAWSGGQEVVVPALRFPVTKKPEGQPWFRDAVMIPLVRDLIDVPAANPVPMMVK